MNLVFRILSDGPFVDGKINLSFLLVVSVIAAAGFFIRRLVRP